jgi:hypothetical protein
MERVRLQKSDLRTLLYSTRSMADRYCARTYRWLDCFQQEACHGNGQKCWMIAHRLKLLPPRNLARRGNCKCTARSRSITICAGCNSNTHTSTLTACQGTQCPPGGCRWCNITKGTQPEQRNPQNFRGPAWHPERPRGTHPPAHDQG